MSGQGAEFVATGVETKHLLKELEVQGLPEAAATVRRVAGLPLRKIESY